MYKVNTTTPNKRKNTNTHAWTSNEGIIRAEQSSLPSNPSTPKTPAQCNYLFHRLLLFAALTKHMTPASQISAWRVLLSPRVVISLRKMRPRNTPPLLMTHPKASWSKLVPPRKRNPAKKPINQTQKPDPKTRPKNQTHRPKVPNPNIQKIHVINQTHQSKAINQIDRPLATQPPQTNTNLNQPFFFIFLQILSHCALPFHLPPNFPGIFIFPSSHEQKRAPAHLRRIGGSDG
ncbi:hypothetical protein QBC41DRAFT_121319 [Cercophora samala]|uniref:Uncharacterized protein n=1 Tax=Cercophora samala TaxID=330535 RepID=A0AA39ZDJ2_9PEZI|nr:hypothetical protein QBC41DRAFT_121319 [Cercophora samala]